VLSLLIQFYHQLAPCGKDSGLPANLGLAVAWGSTGGLTTAAFAQGKGDVPGYYAMVVTPTRCATPTPLTMMLSECNQCRLPRLRRLGHSSSG